MPIDLPSIGVVVVTFNAADVILDNLESLLAVKGVRLKIVVVENASTDGTAETIEAWASGATPYTNPGDIPFDLPTSAKPVQLTAVNQGQPIEMGTPGDVTLIRADANGGFASGVNIGLAALAALPEIDLFWVLNPDSVTTPTTPAAYAQIAQDAPGFGLMGGRVCYMDPPDQIQIDGGTVNKWTGVTGNIHLGASHAATDAPDPAAIDFVMGANIIVSRSFYDTVGPMPEDYFLYYEEVEWAWRGRALPLLNCPDALIHHRAGTSIGSPTLDRLASPFSLYFKHRGRMRYIARTHIWGLPTAYAFGWAKAAQTALKGGRKGAVAMLRAIHGLNPPAEVAQRLSPEAQRLAFGGHR